MEGVPQSLDDSVVILDVDEEDRYTSSDDLLMSDAEFDHSRGEHQRGKEGGPNGLDVMTVLLHHAWVWNTVKVIMK